MEDCLMQANMYNGLCLAYIGDSIYEIYIRKHILSLGYTKVKDLHKKVTEFTCGEAQALAMYYLLNENLLSDEEISYYKRGRNSHVNSNRKNIDIKTYLDATGFEALIGFLYLDNQIDRLEEIINIVINLRR